MNYRTSALATGLFFGLLVSLPASAERAPSASASAPAASKQSQPSIKAPQLRSATVRKPSGSQANQIEQFVRENKDQIRASRAKGNGC